MGRMSHRPASARRAEAADADRIATLREAALAEIRSQRGGALYAAKPFDGATVWAGCLAGDVVGYLAATIGTAPAGERLGVVDAVYVDPACRAVGVGEAMMDAALEWFRSEGCIGVDAVALPGARATKNFFEESGFSARSLLMHHRF